MIVGGWEYIIAAYSLTWVVIGIYAVSLWRRFKGVARRKSELP